MTDDLGYEYGDTCDWGGCDEPAVATRESATHGLLPVCARHGDEDAPYIPSAPILTEYRFRHVDDDYRKELFVGQQDLGDGCIVVRIDTERDCSWVKLTPAQAARMAIEMRDLAQQLYETHVLRKPRWWRALNWWNVRAYRVGAVVFPPPRRG